MFSGGIERDQWHEMVKLLMIPCQLLTRLLNNKISYKILPSAT